MTEYMTIKQLSEYTSLHPNTLKNWLKKGMPCYRIGRCVRVKRDEFDEWMKRFRTGGTTEKSFNEIKKEALKEVLK